MATANTKKSNNVEANELYSTPKIALSSFYHEYPEVFEDFYTYYDPCNGLGDIADYLRSIGKEVITGDIIDYGNSDKVEDFLQVESLPKGVECIIFNPPFTLTEEFVDKALQLCPNVLMFNRMTTIESISRAKKFDSKVWPLANMWQFGFRVSCTKGVNREPTANSVAYSWFEFDKNNPRYTTLNWITEKR